jgi:hypothetical protein
LVAAYITQISILCDVTRISENESENHNFETEEIDLFKTLVDQLRVSAGLDPIDQPAVKIYNHFIQVKILNNFKFNLLKIVGKPFFTPSLCVGLGHWDSNLPKVVQFFVPG